jgi:hypothetical protein
MMCVLQQLDMRAQGAKAIKRSQKRLLQRGRLLLRGDFWLTDPVIGTEARVVVVAGLASRRLHQFSSSMVPKTAGVEGVAVGVSLVVLGVAGLPDPLPQGLRLHLP